MNADRSFAGAPSSRRELLARTSAGFGWLAASALLGRSARAAGDPRRVPGPDFAPRARSVIFCYMSGGVSHVDSFDPKPRLVRDAGGTFARDVSQLFPA